MLFEKGQREIVSEVPAGTKVTSGYVENRGKMTEEKKGFIAEKNSSLTQTETRVAL